MFVAWDSTWKWSGRDDPSRLSRLILINLINMSRRMNGMNALSLSKITVALALASYPPDACQCHAFSSTLLSSTQPSYLTRSFAAPLDIFYDSTNYLHRDMEYHPECPDRIDHCLDALRRHFPSENNQDPTNSSVSHGIIDVAANTTIPSTDGPRHREHSSPLTVQELEHAENMLAKIHDSSLIADLKGKCEAPRKDASGWIGYIDGSDTYVTTGSYDVGVRATGAWIRAVDVALGAHDSTAPSTTAVAETWTKPAIGMALTRPPGHHATYSLSNGFCIFNFAMAAAAHAISIDPSMKISILDWDVHFGQGVMDILDKCSSSALAKNVRYVSLHQVPCFPHEGQSRKVQGCFNNVMTIPIQPESTWSCGYKELFTTYALPFVCTEDEWEPDLVVVCAGYDALDSDELAGVNLVAKDYGEMTRLLLDQIGCSSNKHPGLVFGLEGGYQLREGVAGGNLSDALIETIKALQ